MAGPRTRHYYPSQRVTETTCPTCNQPVIEFFDLGVTFRIEPTQAPITRTPQQHHLAGRMVWRLNLPTGRWGYEPLGARCANPVHLNHVCPERKS